MAESALLQRVLLRIAMCKTDEEVQEMLQKYLTPVLLKAVSPDATVRGHVIVSPSSSPHTSVRLLNLQEMMETMGTRAMMVGSLLVDPCS